MTTISTEYVPEPIRAPAVPEWYSGKRNNNPAALSFRKLLLEDFNAHNRDLFEQGFWAVAVHRFGNWRMGIRSRLLRAPFSILYKCLEWLCGISLPYTVKLGRRVRIWHHSGILISARSIGDDVQVRQNTTLG